VQTSMCVRMCMGKRAREEEGGRVGGRGGKEGSGSQEEATDVLPKP